MRFKKSLIQNYTKLTKSQFQFFMTLAPLFPQSSFINFILLETVYSMLCSYFIQILFMLHKSRLTEEEKVYVGFDRLGKTQIFRTNDLQPNLSYRRVHNTHEEEARMQFLRKKQHYIDLDFVIDQYKLNEINQRKEKIVLKRLYELYQSNKKYRSIQFFSTTKQKIVKGYKEACKLPPLMTELQTFPFLHYKSFFITQEFSKFGKYEMIINHNGKFQFDTVDDWIPVYQDSLQPLWGFSLQEPWKLILLKFWAKRLNGYERIPETPPFRFLQCFSNANWKYFNLEKEGHIFLNKYVNKNLDLGRFVLKTKNSREDLEKIGLVPHSAGYEMIGLSLNQNIEKNNALPPINERRYVVTIRSTMPHQWSGQMSILDQQINNKYVPSVKKLSFSKDLMMSQTDFLNVFSTAYISSKRDEDEQIYFSDYYLLSVEPNIKSSIYLSFEAEKDGWFDFSIRQSDNNRVVPTKKSIARLGDEGEKQLSDGRRYLKCKFILVKENTEQSPSKVENKEYFPPTYDTYEIQYYHGYNKGDAKFLFLDSGRYIFKIKPEAFKKQSLFIINYASNMRIKINQIFPEKLQTSRIMREAMASLIGDMSSQHSSQQISFEQVVYSNSFENIGYGFIGARLNIKCPYHILIDVDPILLQKEGYKIKNKFKGLKQPFGVEVKPGQSTSIVLKKIEAKDTYVWPPKSIQIFKNKV